jgi:hypothetical protein
MGPRYEVRECGPIPQDAIITEINLDNLDWGLIAKVSKARPMAVCNMREELRNHIAAIGRVRGLPKLESWAASLSPAALDMLTHFGFSESHFWQGLTGVPCQGFVALGHGPRTADDGNHRVALS